RGWDGVRQRREAVQHLELGRWPLRRWQLCPVAGHGDSAGGLTACEGRAVAGMTLATVRGGGARARLGVCPEQDPRLAYARTEDPRRSVAARLPGDGTCAIAGP